VKIIRGTGDAKKMKGQATSQSVRTMRCTNCGQQAMKTRTPDGQEIYKCGACGCGFKATKF
jgi:hypothetical protein